MRAVLPSEGFIGRLRAEKEMTDQEAKRVLKQTRELYFDLPKENIPTSFPHSPCVDDLLAMKSHGTGTSPIKEGDLNLYGDLLTGTCVDTTMTCRLKYCPLSQ